MTFQLKYSRIAGTGSHLPEKVVANADLEKMVETSDQWIQERTGIRQRHIAAQGETTVDNKVTMSMAGQIKRQIGFKKSVKLLPDDSQITISESRHQRDSTIRIAM